MTLPGDSPVICFLDESATDASDLDFAVLGGTVMNRRDIPDFNTAWLDMLVRHRAPNGLHMCDLGPRGPYPHLVQDACVAMLADAVSVINGHRIFTFGASWDNRKHEALFSPDMRQQFLSVYAMAFMMAVEINRSHAVRANYSANIDYIVDDGNRYKAQVSRMHREIKSQPELSDRLVGALDFRTDTDVPALQAADVIAWATRRVNSGKELMGVHEPLKALFDDSYIHSPAPIAIVETMAKRFELAEHGVDPDLPRQ